MRNEFMTMREIGEVFGVTSHKIGKMLKFLDYRTDKGRPSQKAHEENLVNQRWADNHINYLWAWHKDKTVAILERAGLEKVENE